MNYHITTISNKPLDIPILLLDALDQIASGAGALCPCRLLLMSLGVWTAGSLACAWVPGVLWLDARMPACSRVFPCRREHHTAAGTSPRQLHPEQLPVSCERCVLASFFSSCCTSICLSSAAAHVCGRCSGQH